MPEPIKVRIITPEEQEEKYKNIVYFFLFAGIIALLYFAYNYIRKLGFNSNSAIAVMIVIPVIFLILIFKGKKIYWAIKSLFQDKYHKEKYKRQNRKGFLWLSLIILLILIVLFLQYYPKVSTYINNSIQTNKNIESGNSFLELAKNKGYPKLNVLSKAEASEICTLKCNSNSMNLNSYTETLSFDVIECSCSNMNTLAITSGQQTEVKEGDYYLDLKTLKEITREEFMQRIGK